MTKYDDMTNAARHLLLERGDTPDDAFIVARDDHEGHVFNFNLDRATLERLRDDITQHLKYPPLTDEEQMIVRAIRILWAGDGDMLRVERKQPRSLPDYMYPFGNASYEEEGASADHELLRAFRAERPHHDSDLDAIWAMIRG